MVAMVTIVVLAVLVVAFGVYYARHDRAEFAVHRTATRRRRGVRDGEGGGDLGALASDRGLPGAGRDSWGDSAGGGGGSGD